MRNDRPEHRVRSTGRTPIRRAARQTTGRAAYARHRLNCPGGGKAARGHVFASNRTGEIPPSGMIEEDAGNGLRHGMRHRRCPEKGPAPATPRCPPAPRLRPTRLRHVADIQGAGRGEMVEPMVANVPGQVLDRGAVVRRSTQVEPGVLVVVQAVALEQVPVAPNR